MLLYQDKVFFNFRSVLSSPSQLDELVRITITMEISKQMMASCLGNKLYMLLKASLEVMAQLILFIIVLYAINDELFLSFHVYHF